MEETKNPSQPTARWIRREHAAEVYSNEFFINWSRTDVRVRFGQMIPTNEIGDKIGFVVEEGASVTMSWPQAKALRNALNDTVERYEKTNGMIDLENLKLPQ